MYSNDFVVYIEYKYEYYFTMLNVNVYNGNINIIRSVFVQKRGAMKND